MLQAMSLFIVHVSVYVKPGTADAFKSATRENARSSRQEPGVVRFDLLQYAESAEKFLLVEIYRNETAAASHKETAHYKIWRDTVADMMAEPRSSVKFTNVDPDDSGF
jgi:quinol monooxygenase YgiN